MESAIVRIPQDTLDSARQFAALHGTTIGAELAKAWRAYVEEHKDEFASDLEKAAALVRENDIEGLARLMNRNAGARGLELAARAGNSGGT